ncbi:tail fiber protein [Synechococcus elongatus]|uniref:tail fiber protein n=1 Tax=Synechococcus elongatus TaxID=32046 RepID=UPI000F7E3DD9|nr:tail fiber protein [Synechococcus elongatus]
MTIGIIVPWDFSVVPALWALCDGTVYNVAQFPIAGALLGNRYGGNGTTTFAVPSLVDRMIKGAANDGEVGTVQTARAGTTTPVSLPVSLELGDSGLPTVQTVNATYSFSSDNTHTHAYTAVPAQVNPASANGTQHVLQAGDPATAIGHRSPIAGNGIAAESHRHTVPSGTTDSTANHLHVVAFSNQSASHIHTGTLSRSTTFQPEGGGVPTPRTATTRFIIKLAEPA